MAPFKSSLGKSLGKLLGVSNQRDLTLRGAGQNSRRISIPTISAATGGIIGEYESGGVVYKTHTFTTSGAFQVTSGSGTIEYLLVAGGGGGGMNIGGGGGAGGLITNLSGHPLSTGTPFPVNSTGGPNSDGYYPITIGRGGSGAQQYNTGADTSGDSGTNSTLNPGITAIGGGRGGSRDGTPPNGQGATTGGSGGGGGGGNPGTPTLTAALGTPGQGNPGGDAAGYAIGAGGGGGGAGGPGGSGISPGTGGTGGLGVQVLIAGPSTNGGFGSNGPGTEYNYFAGGGGGAGGQPGTNPGGGGGGGPVPAPYAGGGGGQPDSIPLASPYQIGYDGTGGGGGGGSTNAGVTGQGAPGGNGICIIRYQVSSSTATAKASGGAITFYNGKTIHTFVGPGKFITSSPFNETVEYVIIGGGGGGGGLATGAGGGGAGGYRTGTTPITGAVNYTVTVGSGGKAWNMKAINFNVANRGPSFNSSSDGQPSVFGPLSVPGGARGNSSSPTYDGHSSAGYPGASGSGAAGGAGGGTDVGGSATGSPFPGAIGATPASGWGHPGGNSNAYSPERFAAGGGGGAGSAGSSGSNHQGGSGGRGIQLPATFRDPANKGIQIPGPTSAYTNGDTSGLFWFAGGGGGGIDYVTSSPNAGATGGGPGATVVPVPGTSGRGWAGAGNASLAAPPGGYPHTPSTDPAGDALVNSGSGGGGGSGFNDGQRAASMSPGGNGGPGIVMVAYPT